VRELVEFLVRALVEQPDKVEVEEFEEDGDLVLEVSVAEDDLGRVIGRGGRIANAIRTVARAAGARDERRVIVDILDWAPFEAPRLLAPLGDDCGMHSAPNGTPSPSTARPLPPTSAPSSRWRTSMPICGTDPHHLDGCSRGSLPASTASSLARRFSHSASPPPSLPDSSTPGFFIPSTSASMPSATRR